MSYTILITGGTTGLGFATVQQLIHHHPSATILIANRTHTNVLNRLNNKPNVKFVQLDLASQSSIRQFISDYRNSHHPPLRYLILNSGIHNMAGGVPVNDQGVEMTFAVNNIGHFLLFQLLRPYFDKTETRITVTASDVHDAANKLPVPPPTYRTGETLQTVQPSGEDIKRKGTSEDGSRRYATSKLMSILFTYELHRRLRKAGTTHITVNAFNPGFMPETGLAGSAPLPVRVVMMYVLPYIMPITRMVVKGAHTSKESAHALAKLATFVETKYITGTYFTGLEPEKSSVQSYELDRQKELWDVSVKLMAKDAKEAEMFNSM